jgi:putative ABC transport system permease protein
MSRLQRLFRRRKLNAELADEIRAHIEERADELVEAGMNRADALHAARAQFGNPTFLLEESRTVWSFASIENALRDLRIGARALRRNPLFTAVAVSTLALGIGANAAIFSLINAIMLRPLPFPEPDRIVMLWEVPSKRLQAAAPEPNLKQNQVSPINFLEWRERTHSFAAMAAISPFPMGLSGYGEPREVDALQVSADFFRVLGVAPLMGRTFTTAEDVPDGPPVVVLSYALWRQQFGANRSILGRLVQLHDKPYSVIGVMPETFDLPFQRAEIWVPAQIAPGGKPDEGRYLSVIARLKPGVPMPEAQADMNAVAHEISRERPSLSLDWTTNVLSIYDQTTGRVSAALLLLFGAVTFVLLIAAGNVGNLLLMRGAGRQREIAVRAALGASRPRIVGQLLAESLLLALAGGALGIGLAFVGLRAIIASLPALALPRIDAVHVDARVLGFSLVLCIVTTLLFGLAPALTFSRANPDDALKQSGLRTTARGAHRIRGLLVVAEVALSLVLLTGAGLLARSFLNQTSVDRGFRIDHILTMRMFFAPARYYEEGRRSRYGQDILARVRSLPGVEDASSVHFLPMTGFVSGSCFSRADRPEPAPGMAPNADFLIVSPRYFAVMRIPMIAGRDFNEHDRMGTEPGIVVNEAFARRFYPNEDPIGKRLNLCWNVPEGAIIGVTANARQASLTVTPYETIFLDQAQTPMYFGALVIRTALPPSAMARAAEDAVHAVDPDQAISHVETMEDVVSESVARPRLESVLLGIFAAIALVLAIIGLYGVLAYVVTQQTREIGIRMALGADSSRLVREILGHGLGLMLAAIAAGLILALALTRYIGSLLYDVKPTDPPTFIAACVALLAAGLVASWLPARRAAAVDPMRSLRWE